MQMTSTYQDAINGTLVSQTSGESGNPLTFNNATAIPLDMYLISADGDHYGWNGITFEPGTPPYRLEPNGGQSMTQANPELQWYWLFTSPYSGAFAAVFKTPDSGTDGGPVTITSFDLLDPDDIGGIPEPDDDVIIPSGSPRIVVGCGTLGNGNPVVREQYWQRTSDSYSIGPGEHKEVSNTVVSGLQSTTSDLTTVESSVGASAQAGWGPVSASISASLSAASTTFQQVTATSQTVSYISDTYDNPVGNPPQTYLYWQLTDSVTVYDKDSSLPLSTIVTGTQPVVIGGPYTLPTSVPAGPQAALGTRSH